MRRLPIIIAALTFLVGTVTGCTYAGMHECVDYISLGTPAAMAQEATTVVTGARIGTADDVRMYGESAHVHLVRVDSVLKGTATVGKTLTVISLPQTCSSAAYPNGDQMDVAGEAEFFVRNDGDRVTTLTPDAGALAIPAGGALPWAP